MLTKQQPPEYWRPTNHRMSRRSREQNYSAPGIYHVTLKVDTALRLPFGTVEGNVDAPADSPDFPHVALSPLGRMVQEELLHSICRYYPMVQVEDYVIMPEHLHFLLRVTDMIVSQHGREAHLGQVIAGFKKGCNRRYWNLMTQQGKLVATSAHAAAAQAPAAATGHAPAACALPFSGKEAAVSRPPSKGNSGRPPLFAPQYVDVIPLSTAEVEDKRRYIRNNPLNRLRRMEHRDSLHTGRAAIDTSLTPSALRGYLQRECAPYPPTAAELDAICARLLLIPHTAPYAPPPLSKEAAACALPCTGKDPSPTVTCDAYGHRALLQRRLLPVVCHRKDAASRAEQKAVCLKAAAEGAVLVSARIAKGEQDIIDTAQAAGLPIIRVLDNGIPEIYHPSEAMQQQVAEGRLLLVTPWRYEYRHKDETVNVPFCKTMNCVVQAICRLKDDWWKP